MTARIERGESQGRGGSALAAFLAQRETATAKRPGNGGTDLCRLLTEALDRAIAELYTPFAGERLAAVAIGGYGRGEQCLHSDVDLLLLHGGRLPQRAVETIFYPLWDARLKVGHSVRTVKDALAAVRDQYETLTALLDARVVAGDASLLAELQAGLGDLLRRNRVDVAGPLVEAVQARREREPYQLLDANLKEGRGGLRDLQALHWTRRAAALADTLDPMPVTVAEREAKAALLAARNGLHSAAGRPHEVYDFELRPAAAAWLGLDVTTAGQRLYAAVRTVDRLALAWSDAVGEEPAAARPPSARGFLSRFTQRRPTPAETAPAPAPASPSSPLVLAARSLGRPARRAVFSPEEEAIIRSAGGPAWDAADRSALVELVGAGMRGWQVWNALDDLGWVGRALPEWRHVVAAPQHVPFHLHPLDVHLWRTVLELQAIGKPDSDERWCPDVAAELGALDDALLAALFHDIGKGWQGDHSVTGATAASAFLRRARFGPAITGAVTGAIRHHLLLPTVATRRDIDDPRVIIGVADQAGDLRSLRILYLLSVADSRATGPSAWNTWKASLVRTLFARTADELARRAGQHLPSADEEARIAEIERAASGRIDPALVREHARAMPDGYVTVFETGEVLHHLELLAQPLEGGAIHLGVEPGAEATTVTVVAEDRPGLLSLISGVFALHNVSVLDGRFFSRADNVVLDAFRVRDTLGGRLDDSRWARVRADMARAAIDALPLETLLQEKVRAYRSRSAPPTGARVLVDTDAAEGETVVEVHCGDRIGLLHDIARGLYELGLDIRLAKIDTLGHDVVDAFYVKSFDGEPLRDPARLTSIRSGLEARLRAPLE